MPPQKVWVHEILEVFPHVLLLARLSKLLKVIFKCSLKKRDFFNVCPRLAVAWLSGVKWSATKWIHVGHFADTGEAMHHVERIVFVPPPPPSVPGCIDDNSMCVEPP